MTTPVTENSGKNIRNLKPFKKGQSGNPGGRPKTSDFAEEVREYLRGKQGNQTRLQVLLKRLSKTKPEILLYYGFGKPAESIGVKLELVSGVPADVVDRLSVLARRTAGFLPNGDN